MTLTIDVDPVLVRLGPVALSWYGSVIAIAITAGVWLALREAHRKKLPVAEVESLAFWVLGGGMLGARLFHVIDRWELYASDPLSVFAVWNGGLAIMGAVLGGTAAGVVAASRTGLPLGALSDAAAPGAILGQAIGRLACLFTGDAIGAPTTGFGVIYLSDGAMVPQTGVAYEPVFLYEMAWDLGVLALLWWARDRVRVDGHLFAIYLALYAVGKFALTWRRSETIWIGGLQEAQLLSIAALGVAAAWAWVSSRQRRPLASSV